LKLFLQQFFSLDKKEDLYFSKKSTCIENEAIGGILLNKLCMKNDSLAMLISADDRQYEECELARHSCDTMDFKAMFDVYEKNACDLKNIKLCSDLSNFKFIDYHLDENVTKKIRKIFGLVYTWKVQKQPSLQRQRLLSSLIPLKI
jgi:hypothetical protein